ncbi:MAG TPA: response regulator [Anaerolineales bacterium]|nr:response regulator [Anaerolineales bacterium]
MGQTAASLSRVLIVDDHPNTASMLARALKQFQSPVEVLTARNGKEALDLAGPAGVDVLITDFMMPGMNGLELIERLQAGGGGGHEPGYIILVTAYDSPGLAATARRLKVNQYLIKPVQPEKLRDIVGRALHKLHQPTQVVTGLLTAANFRILVADDEPDNVSLLATRLEHEGYLHLQARDGQETLDKLRSEQPDLLLLDVNMPVKSGFEVLAEMRSDPAISHIPVIVITAARTTVRDVREGLGLGADDYITKPFDWRELTARVRAKLRVKHAEDSLRRRNRELSLLPEIGQDLSARLDVDELSQVLLSRSTATLGAATGHLAVFPPNGGPTLHRCHATRPVEGWDWAGVQDQYVRDGLGATVAQRGTTVIVEDTQRERRWPEVLGMPLRSAVCVPLLSRRGAIGVLTLGHEQPGRFTTEHAALLQAIGSQAAIAIENAQLYALERQRANELVALNALSREIALINRSADLYGRLPLLIQRALGYPIVSFWLQQGTALRMVSQTGADEAGMSAAQLALAPQQVAATGQPAQISGGVAGGAPASGLAVPMFWNARVNGVVGVHSVKANAFQENDRVLLETLAAQIVSALERIHLFENVEQERKRLAAVLRATADPILVLDVDEHIQMLNPAAQKFFAGLALKPGGLLPEGDGFAPFRTLVARGELGVATELTWPDGRVVEVAVAPAPDNCRVITFNDVSRFRELERVKNEFIATASHELKTPLTSIMGYNDLIVKMGPLTAQQTRFVERVRHASSNMLELVQDLVELMRIDLAVDGKAEALDFHGLVAGVVDELREPAGLRRLRLDVELGAGPVLVAGDAQRLKQVVRNLLSNAIKYTPEGGAVRVQLRASADVATLGVADTGLGIPTADLPFIFDKFYRVQTQATQNIEGSGLGLAIVKAIVDQHGGQITAESVEGQGSLFTVTLPIAHTTGS